MDEAIKTAPIEADGPAFIIRAARNSDHRQLLSLARELDSINLPTDSRKLHEAIVCSIQSFRGRVRDRSRAVYLFCAEQRSTGALVAASMLIAKHGTPEAPHYYLEMDSDDRYSHTLRKLFRHPYLRLRHSMDGPTEIGGLIVTKAMRGHPERIGKQISWVRFLYLAKHPGRFENRIVAEMLAPMLPDHGNVFWDHYGRRITGLSFREADILSARDKEFIRALFPDTPLYTFLLPDEVRDSLGATGEATRGAVRLLEQAGMRFLNQIDPFDGGPYYGAETSSLRPIRETRSAAVVVGEPAPEQARSYLIGCEDARGFRAVRAQAEIIAPGRILVEAAALATLGVKPRTRVDAAPLP
ncbi:MAG TPA: arginine N-succinyltransferase [Candidatus Binataceae bacterium]|nr:arginine N-succinyltransferase [Candidatus Binataceae bacterium]